MNTRTLVTVAVTLLRVVLLGSLAVRLEINLFPIRKYHESLPGLNISLMLLASVALLIAHRLERLRGKPREAAVPRAFTFGAAALLVWCGLGVWGSAEPVLGFYTWFSLAACLLYTFVLADECGQREWLRAAVLVIAVMVGVNAVVGLLQSTAGWLTVIPALGIGKPENRQTFGDGTILRAVGLQATANSLAWFLVTLLPALLAVRIVRVRDLAVWQTRLVTGAALLGVLALIVTYSRGSWVAFAVSMATLSAFAYRVVPPLERQRLGRRIALLVLLGTILCAPFMRAIYIRLTEDDRGSAYSRVPMAHVALAMIADNPLLGVGLSNYEAEMRRYDRTPEHISEDIPWPVHNIVLHQAAEAGLPGLLGFLALVGIAWQQGIRAMRSDDRLVQALAIGLTCGVLAFFLTGLKEAGTLGSPQLRLCFLLCGLLLALGRVHRRQPPATRV